MQTHHLPWKLLSSVLIPVTHPQQRLNEVHVYMHLNSIPAVLNYCENRPAPRTDLPMYQTQHSDLQDEGSYEPVIGKAQQELLACCLAAPSLGVGPSSCWGELREGAVLVSPSTGWAVSRSRYSLASAPSSATTSSTCPRHTALVKHTTPLCCFCLQE